MKRHVVTKHLVEAVETFYMLEKAGFVVEATNHLQIFRVFEQAFAPGGGEVLVT